MAFGVIENIGTDKAEFTYTKDNQEKKSSLTEAKNHDQAANFLIKWLEKEKDFKSIKAIGHRIVFGMEHTKPELITTEFLKELKQMSAFDLDHLPEEIKLIEIFQRRFPKVKQIACFEDVYKRQPPNCSCKFAIWF